MENYTAHFSYDAGFGHFKLNLDLRSQVFWHAYHDLPNWRICIVLVRHEVAVEQGVEHFTTNAGGAVPRLGGARYLPFSVN